MAKFLVENGADPNLKDISGQTALMYASKYRNFKIAVYFLEHFAEVRLLMPFDVEMIAAAVNERIIEIYEIRKVIEIILFPCDAPVIAQIISEFTDGLEN